MSFLFCPGQQLIRIRTPLLLMDSLPGDNTDSDNEVNDDYCITDSSCWNSSANMPQEFVDAILDENAETTRNIEPDTYLPPETKRLTFDITNPRL